MKLKNSPDIAGLRNALNERGIVMVEKDDGVVAINAGGGIFIGEVLPPSGDQAAKRVVRFSRSEGDYLDPSLYGYMAKLGKGPEILLQPL